MENLRITLDVMGGDHAPDVILAGALRACDPARGGKLDPVRILLVGDPGLIDERLAALGGDPGFGRLPASEVIGMDEKPAAALRAKKDSTISVGTKAIRKGAAGAFVSMGNTGAVVGAATLMLGTLEGVRRPGIAVTLEVTGHPVTLVDMGANIAPKAIDLYTYGMMGSILQRDCMDVPEPRVGLLNIGEEASKGTDLLRDALGMLEASPLRFLGNVEGGDIFHGGADVIVTDGFTGNVALKLMEGLAAFMLGKVHGELTAHKADWAKAALGNLAKTCDYSHYGGALLLGVQGVVVIGHGRSDDTAVANALALAARALDAGVNADIVRGLEAARLAAPEALGGAGEEA